MLSTPIWLANLEWLLDESQDTTAAERIQLTLQVLEFFAPLGYKWIDSIYFKEHTEMIPVLRRAFNHYHRMCDFAGLEQGFQATDFAVRAEKLLLSLGEAIPVVWESERLRRLGA